MNQDTKQGIVNYINAKDAERSIVREISLVKESVLYNTQNLTLHRAISRLTDEELIRAYLTVRLVSELGCTGRIEYEKEYTIGRPSSSTGRVDIIVRYPQDWMEEGLRDKIFLFIECKSPSKYESDKDYLQGQIFDLSRQEEHRPKFGIYYTAEQSDSSILDRATIINLEEYSSYEIWDSQGQPSNSILPERYGVARNIVFANTEDLTEARRPLRQNVTREEFDRLRKDVHNVIWGGGGTNNNDVFIILLRLFLCRLYDELETPPDSEYRFQRTSYDNGQAESPADVVANMSRLFRDAARNYLGYNVTQAEELIPFDGEKISPAKVAYVVEQLQDKSLTRNQYRDQGDLLGDFFESIVSQDFTQTKGQFFTHVNIVRFCIELSGFPDEIIRVFREERDPQGRPRIPKVIDPSCGSGTFLIETLKVGTQRLASLEISSLPRRLKEYASMWFGLGNLHGWSREFIYGIESNSDLGLASKVNMILHGDGSTNIFVRSGLEPFARYSTADRSHGLAVTKDKDHGFPYTKACNEEFDFIFTNPPFSISLSADEKRVINEGFDLGADADSENLFIERWYQLLRSGGRAVAVVPETVLDSSSNTSLRLFILKYFWIRAVISLPYVSFKPFTSTKTCVLFLEKKSDHAVVEWESQYNIYSDRFNRFQRGISSTRTDVRCISAQGLLGISFEECRTDELIDENRDLIAEYRSDNGAAWILRHLLHDNEQFDSVVFMAEPLNVGYKRRKGLSDLDQPNDLFNNQDGPSVLNRYFCDGPETLRYGFRVNVSDIAGRPGLRIDPKYAYLWCKRHGAIGLSDAKYIPLRSMLVPYSSQKVRKGPLDEPRLLVDLANVESRTSITQGISEVEEIGSDKIEFGTSTLGISKLEPYLGKVIINDLSQKWIGSPEWLLYDTSDEVHDIDFLRFLLLEPKMLEAYRSLQSGKRHARFSEYDFLSLKVPYVDADTQAIIGEQCRERMQEIIAKREEIYRLRQEIDSILGI